jgi:hypothetical protein
LLEALGRLDQFEALGHGLRAARARVVAELACRDELAEVLVALLVLDQRDHAPRPSARIADLRAEDRPRSTRALGRAQEVDRTGERVDVGQGQRGEPELRRARQQSRRRIDADEERVPAVGSEGDVHRCPPGVPIP